MLQPITSQPKKGEQKPAEKETEGTQLRGLSSLSITNSILIEIEKKCCSCGWDAHYIVKNMNSNDSVMFTAVEELHCCYFGSLQNVIIRDLQKVAIARVCYKEKSCLSGDMVIAVYSPPDLLIASIKEISSCFTNSSVFRSWDSEGQKLFCIKYDQGLVPQLCGCSASFTVTSEENKSEVAEITEKNKERLRLRFKTKLNVTQKMILTGFCLGLIHKSYKQKLTAGKDQESND